MMRSTSTSISSVLFIGLMLIWQATAFTSRQATCPQVTRLVFPQFISTAALSLLPSSSTCKASSSSSSRRDKNRQLTFSTRLQASSQQGGGGGGVGLGEGILKFIRNDALSLTVGTIALLALIINRFATEELFDSQSRTDILGVFSAGSLLLNGLTLQVGEMG